MSKIILGTVQMGLKYGINNNVGRISFEESHHILLTASLSGIRTIDTAEAYGNAHKIIGEFHRNNPNTKFQIITKLPHYFEVSRIEEKVKKYLEELEVSYLEVLMFHSFDSFKLCKGGIESLMALKSKGLVKNIGISVYTNSQLEYLVDNDSIDVVQLPFNLLDNYSVRGNLIEHLKNNGKTIHSRSAFLQGLFFKQTSDEISIVQKLQSELEILHELAKQSNCSMEQLALSYCLHQRNIDNVIIGVDSIDHLNTNVNASFYNIEDNIVKKINSIKIEDLDLLNPSLW
jgi:aryl-alcohol dehydrogenase-like predicted oxidoreductase